MKKQLLVLGTIVTLTLSGCGANTNDKDKSNDNMSNMNHEQTNHSSSSEVPQGLKVAENPTYKVGTQATVKASHMESMNGAKANNVVAYDTTDYVFSYKQTNGGAKVNNHKWVIQEEIENAGDKTLEPGTEVTLKADHMEGMNGAKAIIDSAEKTTVYMVDYTTADGEQVKNHKWVTESELSK
jgi:hypothetical protein